MSFDNLFGFNNLNAFGLHNRQMDLQVMDRCHRIGQTKPVHVYRLATAQSVEVFYTFDLPSIFVFEILTFGVEYNLIGPISEMSFSKLRLEHVVIAKGQLQQEREKTDNGVLEVRLEQGVWIDD